MSSPAVWDAGPPEYDAVLADAPVDDLPVDAAKADEAVRFEPAWVLAAAEDRLRENIAAGATHSYSSLGVDVLAAARVFEALELQSPEALARDGRAGTLLDGVVAATRLIARLQALGQRWLAAFARPGVSVPLDELVASCMSPGNRREQALRVPDELPADLPVGADGAVDLTPLVSHPHWRVALETEASRLAAAEVGCALRIAPITARLRTEAAVTMVDQLPATLAAQQAGDLDGYRASIIAAGTATLSPAQRHAVEERVLRYADGTSPSVLRDLVKRESITIDPESAARRVTRAKAGRGVGVTKSDDDMAVFTALLGASEAELGFALLDGVAVALTSAGLADGRTLPQLRADVLVDIFDSLATTGSACLDVGSAREGEAAGAGLSTSSSARAGAGADARAVTDATSGTGGASCEPRPMAAYRRTGAIVDLHAARAGHTGAAGAGVRRPVCLNVYVNASTLAGIDDAPGDLAGYGLITADTARALAASADTVRALVMSDRSAARAPVTTAPELVGVHSQNATRARVCGTPLDAGRAVYRPPAAVYDYVTARDRTCQFPACRMAARRCDIDHRVPYDDPDYGASCPCNLDTLCRFHHRTKTFTAWRADPGPDGLLVWTSPVGRRYPTESPHVLTLPAGANSTASPLAADRRAADRPALNQRTAPSSSPGNRRGPGLESAPGGAVGSTVTDARGPGDDDGPPF